MDLRDIQAKLKPYMTEALKNVCTEWLTFQSNMCIQALIGITLDEHGVMLIDLKDEIKNEHELESVVQIYNVDDLQTQDVQASEDVQAIISEDTLDHASAEGIFVLEEDPEGVQCHIPESSILEEVSSKEEPVDVMTHFLQDIESSKAPEQVSITEIHQLKLRMQNF